MKQKDRGGSGNQCSGQLLSGSHSFTNVNRVLIGISTYQDKDFSTLKRKGDVGFFFQVLQCSN